MELLKELGQRIQKARKEKNLTQQELADLSHVSLKHVKVVRGAKRTLLLRFCVHLPECWICRWIP